MTPPHQPPAPGPVRVVAAVVRRDGRYLLGRRPQAKRHGGLWEFPGGKMDPGESVLDAARRELSEELELGVTAVGARLLSVSDVGSPFVIDFVEVLATGSPTPLEHDAVGWFLPGEILDLPLAPADARFAERLASGTVDPEGDALPHTRGGDAGGPVD